VAILTTKSTDGIQGWLWVEELCLHHVISHT